MLVAPDDDSAVREALDALAKEGYAEAELDQIGDMQDEPDESRICPPTRARLKAKCPS